MWMFSYRKQRKDTKLNSHKNKSWKCKQWHIGCVFSMHKLKLLRLKVICGVPQGSDLETFVIKNWNLSLCSNEQKYKMGDNFFQILWQINMIWNFYNSLSQPGLEQTRVWLSPMMHQVNSCCFLHFFRRITSMKRVQKKKINLLNFSSLLWDRNHTGLIHNHWWSKQNSGGFPRTLWFLMTPSSCGRS